MSRKNILVCVKQDILHPISWALKEFEKQVFIKYADNTKQIDALFDTGIDFAVLIIDSIIQNNSTLGYLETLKQVKPNQKILLIISEGARKEDIVNIVKSKLVSGILVRPFTAEQISDYIYKLCGFQKPTEVPWYMKTGLKG